MLFSSKQKIFFVHIPKNAGNSIRPLCRKEGIKVITHNIRRRNKRLLAAHRGKQKIHAFCISRNPYDRLVSAYYYLKEKTTHKHDLLDREKFISKYNDFDDFVRNGLEKASKEQLHFLPQVFWVLNSAGKPEIETVLRMENLQKDFDEFCKIMNLRNYKLEVTNASKRRSWEEYYNEETKKIVQDIYHDDFDFFDYPK
ncbi:MAG: sulfotransferase family 2 domain-containing protein [Prolixibacteraceae bacterium]|nr:sulfotransferase family 2 domain-containing protein [Prolixibacteraceae bacterium]